MADDAILIWGAGAIGGTVGAYLVRAGRRVIFVDIEAAHVAAIRDPALGLTIEGPIDSFTVTAPAFTPDRLEGVFRTVFLCVKAQHTEDATRSLLPHLAPDGCVVSLQNGLNEATIAAIAGAARTVGCFINFSADWHGPGRILFGSRGPVVLGEIDGRMTDRLAALHAVLRDFEPDAQTTDNLWGYLWGKLGYGAMLFAQALGEKGIADCLARPELLGLWRRIGSEVMAIAAAEGVRPVGFSGFDPAAYAPGATKEAARASVAAMVERNRPNAKTHSGIWRDLWVRHRRTECDAQLLPMVAAGKARGVPCPVLARLAEMIHDCEAGRRPMSDDNLTGLARA